MKEMRERADYEPNKHCSARDAYQATLYAQKVLLALNVAADERPPLVPKAEPAVEPQVQHLQS